MKFFARRLLTVFLVHLQVAIFFSLNLQLMHARSPGNETDRLALLKFKAGIASDPHGIFNSWNDSLPFCQWNGITCSRRHQRVTSMVFEGQNLIGSISPFIGNLSFLGVLDLQNNSFNGPIPQEVGNLFRLQLLLLNNNTIDGEIPINLTRCSQLRIIYLYDNNLYGKIPAELGSLRMLQQLEITQNKLTGEIPPSLGNLSLLTSLFVGKNMLKGNIPNDLSRLTSLKFLSVGINELFGMIPPSLFNVSSLTYISAALNQLNGSLPNNIGLTLKNLQQFGIGGNLFSGTIPNSVCNASQLQILDVSMNYFAGPVPDCLGNLANLSWLNIGSNNLGNNSTGDLNFLTSLTNCSNLKILAFESSNFGGVLPESIGNLSVLLTILSLASNQITGIIPDSLGNFINLIALDMKENLFTGITPSSLGKLEKLQVLFLQGNKLSGPIPSFIGNLTQLSRLSLSQNKFEGSIPASMANCRYLQTLDISENNLSGFIPNEIFHLSLYILLNLSQNSLTGDLPADVGKLTNIYALDISGNNLSGEIPATIGSCSSLEYLYMQGNSFQNTIPSSLASLKGLQHLDLSQNNLTGEIPNDLQSLQFLSYLNLSFNDLVGAIPTGGVFRNVSEFSVMGNNKLCGGVPQLHLPKCPIKAITKGRSIAFQLAITIPCVIFFVLFMLAAILAYRNRETKKRLSVATEEMGSLGKVSYWDLYHATSRFSEENFIGSGGFGSVYKGFINQWGRHVAIKVIKLETNGASKSFMTECRVLTTVRHRNIVKLLAYCSSIDYKHSEFKALVFELMGNGNLEKRLHDRNDRSRNLNFVQRLNIAIDVANALYYLHDLYGSPIIHCDLKPSNVLLDEEMVAHVSDFGVARLFLTNNGESQSHTSSIGIRGTFGYAPPEYGMGAEASKEGDVYSYGVLVLEMFSGKRPTDQIFQDHLNLHNFVKNALPNRLVHITDPTLFPRGMEETPIIIPEGDEEMETYAEKEASDYGNLSAKEDCLFSVFRVGVACSSESPQERMKMRDVAEELHLIRSRFLGARIYG